jgi:hypothetical protein
MESGIKQQVVPFDLGARSILYHYSAKNKSYKNNPNFNASVYFPKDPETGGVFYIPPEFSVVL